MTIVNVLGTDYEIMREVPPEEDSKMKDSDGYCDFTTKQIKISLMEPDDKTFNDLDAWEQKVIRHELVHAFMYESGLDCNSEWGRDETLIDWIAIQMPKIAEVFKKLNI